MTVKLIASDLDGTLFDTDHKPGPRSVAAVNAARDAGIVVAAVTGRSHHRGAPLAVSTGARLQWFIGSNGGHRLNYETTELEERLVFDDGVAPELCARLDDELGSVGLGWEGPDDLYWNQSFVDMAAHSAASSRTLAAAGPETMTSVGKILVAHPEASTFELVDLISRLAPPGVHVTSSGMRFAELTPEGADKGAALARLCRNLGIDASEVVAFGDNHNDTTMLEWAGTGVAMGTAPDEVKAVADEVTASNVDDGVAQVIERLLG